MEVTPRSGVLFGVRVVRRIIGWTLMLVVAALLILFGLQFHHSSRVDELWLIARLRQWGDPLLSQCASWFHVAWPAPSASFLPIVLALLVWMIKLASDAILQSLHRVLRGVIPAPAAAGAGAAGTSAELLGVDLRGVAADSERTRKLLLQRYREIEEALKTARRKHCTFLSVDVVGSTQMKEGEDEMAIVATFQAFEEMLRRIFEEYGAWKQAWTPDGVMVCFLQFDLAIAAGQRVLENLKLFNRTQNRLRTSFRVRCGLNAGEVAIYEDSKLEKVVDHVIDVAGHMQKRARPNTMWVGGDIYNFLTDKSGFRSADAEIDGLKVYEWSLESSYAASLTSST